MINIGNFELHNIAYANDELAVRNALRTYVLAEAIQASSQFTAGFSLRSPNTTEVFHYLFLRNTSDGNTTLYITSEEFRVIQQYACGTLPPNTVITHAVDNNQLLINSPQFVAPIYGIIGGGVVRATKQASINPDTPAIEIPTGLCCTFGNRIAIAVGSVIYFNDEGSADSSAYIRTFAAQNRVWVPGFIYSMFQGPAGALYIITNNGIYALPADALSQGQMVYGMLTKVSEYSATDYNCAVAAAGGIYALTADGLANIGANINAVQLTNYNGKRYYSEHVGPGNFGDYRSGKLWPCNAGLLVSIDGALCIFDVNKAKASWAYNTDELDVVGMCYSRDGQDILVLPDRLVVQQGNDEYDGYEINGVACGTLTSRPADSPLVRSITTSADNVGQNQLVYMAGTSKSAVTPAANSAENIIGTSLWDDAAMMVSPHMRSRRHQVAVRTDDITLEIGATGSGTRIGLAEIETKGKATRRPTN